MRASETRGHVTVVANANIMYRRFAVLHISGRSSSRVSPRFSYLFSAGHTARHNDGN
jgi:hypothetical protein